jgi:hypothetical protein
MRFFEFLNSLQRNDEETNILMDSLDRQLLVHFRDTYYAILHPLLVIVAESSAEFFWQLTGVEILCQTGLGNDVRLKAK